MATITKRGQYYQVKIRRRGFPQISRSFDTAKQAQAWARKYEADMDRGAFEDPTKARKVTLAKVLKDYVVDVAPTKKGYAAEQSRVRVLLRDPIAQFSLGHITSEQIKQYIKRRMAVVCGSTVNRELALLSRVFTYARADCGIPLPHNPLKGVTRPKNNAARDRRLLPGEEERLVAELSVAPERDERGRFVQGRRNIWLLPLVLLALETAMRRSELLAIRWQDVDLERRAIRLRTSKNGSGRAVPLSTTAVRILQDLPRSIDGRVFPISINAVKCIWPRVVEAAGLVDFHFHDLRHEATTRLFEKGLQVMEVATITGHKDLRMLMRYTHLFPSDLARKLG